MDRVYGQIFVPDELLKELVGVEEGLGVALNDLLRIVSVLDSGHSYEAAFSLGEHATFLSDLKRRLNNARIGIGVSSE